MGIDLIGYRPWDGSRTERNRRFLVIAENILRQKVKQRSLLALYIVGLFLVHVIPLSMYSLMPHDELDPEVMCGYMQDGLFFIFNVILVSLICSDLIADDTRSNSLVLYLSRALRPEGYLLGKWLGAMVTLGLFTLLPPLATSIAITATQSGPDYLGSLAVIGRTFMAGVWTALFMVPVGLMMSTITSKRTYAGVGTFMLFFILMIIAGILGSISADWELLSPQTVMHNSYYVLFGLELPGHVNAGLLGLMALVMTVPPILFVYDRVRRRGVGK